MENITTITDKLNHYYIDSEMTYPLNKMIILLLITLILIIHIIRTRNQNNKLKRIMRKHNFISAVFFESKWVLQRATSKNPQGFKYLDTPGCYIIKCFNHKVFFKSMLKYNIPHIFNHQEVYVGQSLNLTKRVHGHLTGRGNGNIFADFRSNKKLYICLIPCSKKKLNDLERKLIKKYNATNSYNITHGGGKRR